MEPRDNSNGRFLQETPAGRADRSVSRKLHLQLTTNCSLDNWSKMVKNLIAHARDRIPSCATPRGSG